MTEQQQRLVDHQSAPSQQKEAVVPSNPSSRSVTEEARSDFAIDALRKIADGTSILCRWGDLIFRWNQANRRIELSPEAARAVLDLFRQGQEASEANADELERLRTEMEMLTANLGAVQEHYANLHAYAEALSHKGTPEGMRLVPVEPSANQKPAHEEEIVRDWNFLIPSTPDEVCKVLRRRIDVHRKWAEYLEANAEDEYAKNALKAGIGAAENHRLYIRQYEVAIDIISAASSSPASQEGMRLVPVAAIKWLMGEAPAPDGKWFGEDEPENNRERFWWRSKFRELIGDKLVYDKERRTVVRAPASVTLPPTFGRKARGDK